jgi:hypothetical protein
MSGGPSVVGHFSYQALGSGFRNMNPAQVAVACDFYAYERVEGMLVDAVVAMMNERAVDSFLSEYFDVVAEIEMELLFRTPPEPFPETRALGKSARAYAHRFAPLHSFAVEHHRFFQDAEVLELIKERGDMRFSAGPHVAPRRRR